MRALKSWAPTSIPLSDLKANPVHEQEGVVYFRTHYYGGIKKYQWPTIPLALIGVIYTRDGKKVEINVGMKEGDPIFYVSTSSSTWPRTR